MPRVTIACPVDLRADANQLARCIGLGPDDDQTYGEPVWKDAAGNAYAVASAMVGEGFAGAATSPLSEPAWGCDLAAAARAQAKIRVGGAADPAALVAVFSDDARAGLSELGVFQDQGGE